MKIYANCVGEKQLNSIDHNVVAQRPLLLVDKKTGERKSVIVKLGLPYWVEQGTQAACPVLIEGMLKECSIYGTDTFQALELAIGFVNKYLEGRGSELLWDTGEIYGNTEESGTV